MFELSRQPAKLVDVNPRNELNGDEHRLAADLKLTANMPSSMLALFAPTLRSFLYWRNDAVQQDLASESHEAPNLRFPKLGVLAWSYELIGATVTLHYGPSGASDIVLPLANVNAFRLDPQEGGTCIVTWRVQCHPDEKQFGKLAVFLGETLDVTVAPPGEDEAAAPKTAE